MCSKIKISTYVKNIFTKHIFGKGLIICRVHLELSQMHDKQIHNPTVGKKDKEGGKKEGRKEGGEEKKLVSP